MLLPSAAKTTMTVLRPETYHLSPCIGLALSAGGSHFLSRLYELEPKTKVATGARGQAFDGLHTVWKGSPVGALARDLFHRNHPEEPMRPTTNRSLAAAHISSSLCAMISSEEAASTGPGRWRMLLPRGEADTDPARICACRCGVA